MALVLKIMVLSLIIGPLIAAEQTHGCPPYWTKFSNFCYRFYGAPVSYNAAKDRCRESITCDGSATADLVSIHDEAENNFVYRLWRTIFILPGLDVDDFTGSSNRANSVWIGGNDFKSEGTYGWSDGSDFDFDAWKSGNPDNYANREDCVVMWKTSGDSDTKGDNAWNDLTCDRENPFICKMPYV